MRHACVSNWLLKSWKGRQSRDGPGLSRSGSRRAMLFRTTSSTCSLGVMLRSASENEPRACLRSGRVGGVSRVRVVEAGSNSSKCDELMGAHRRRGRAPVSATAGARRGSGAGSPKLTEEMKPVQLVGIGEVYRERWCCARRSSRSFDGRGPAFERWVDLFCAVLRRRRWAWRSSNL